VYPSRSRLIACRLALVAAGLWAGCAPSQSVDRAAFVAEAGAGDSGPRLDERPADSMVPVTDAGPGGDVAQPDLPAADTQPPDLPPPVDEAPPADVAPPDAAPDVIVEPNQAVLVVGDPAAPTPGDTRLRLFIETRGFVVAMIDDSSPASAATGKDLVVIASTVTASMVGTKFRDVAIPLLSLEAAVFDDLGMTGGTSMTDFQEVQGTSVEILVPGHPMAAGTTGTVRVVTVSGMPDPKMNWGKPAATAERVARFDGMAADHLAIFGYTAGTMMVGRVAPARRVGFFAADEAAQRLNDDGLRMLGNAIDWAMR
jgi:hypothetical protein